jgi:hypothetical protein
MGFLSLLVLPLLAAGGSVEALDPAAKSSEALQSTARFSNSSCCCLNEAAMESKRECSGASTISLCGKKAREA